MGSLEERRPPRLGTLGAEVVHEKCEYAAKMLTDEEGKSDAGRKLGFILPPRHRGPARGDGEVIRNVHSPERLAATLDRRIGSVSCSSCRSALSHAADC